MCEIMTIITALIFSVIYFSAKKKGKPAKASFSGMLIFSGAALMWACDGIASVISGEPFFDISMEDTILGVIILVFGLSVVGISYARNARKNAKQIQES